MIKDNLKIISKKAQVTIFIIIAVGVIAIVIAFFALRGGIVSEEIPASIEPIYSSFLSCIGEEAKIGIDVLGTQAGYIYLPDFEPGSRYMPFSSQLDVAGSAVPYWYYVSGNNIQKEQVPSKQEMEKELANFIESRIRTCDFDSYYDSGFQISLGEPNIQAQINSNSINVNVEMDFSVIKGEDSVFISNHNTLISSDFGKLYETALNIYELEQNELFLEEYAVDNLRLYAPVDGVELGCSPQIWNADEVFDELGDAIEINTLALRTSNGIIDENSDKYFVIDEIDSTFDINFINSKTWTKSFEVNPSSGNILIAEPVGNQQGLGILGFCYIPYHFVYNVKYPILVQISNGEEIFQFPLAIVLQGNNPRQALESSYSGFEIPELCNYKNTPVKVSIYNTNLNPINARISFECSGTSCDMGETSGGILRENLPQCVNGFVVAEAEGYKTGKKMYSVTESGSVDLILDRLYDLELSLNLDNKIYSEQAIINFVSSDLTKTVVYPEQKNVELSEGQYEISVYIYKNSNLNIASSVQEQCIEVPQSGLGALFGATKQECFDMEIPAQIVSNALAGGGKENYYILESELDDSSIIEINAQSLPLPVSIEQLQENYLLFEDRDLEVDFI